MASQQKEFAAQDALQEKLRSFLSYLSKVKLRSAWKPNLRTSDMLGVLRDSKHQFSPSPLLNTIIRSADMINDRIRDKLHDKCDEFLRDYRCSNPNFEGDYDVWERICCEELIAIRE